MSEKRLFWIQQRYVVPVLAESYEEARGIAFHERTAIAREVGPASDGMHDKNRISGPADREGWGDCQPYGGDGRTVAQIEDKPKSAYAVSR